MYEYKTVKLNAISKPTLSLSSGRDPEGKMNELADDGWRFKGTTEQAGGSGYLIFEREVEQ